MKFQSNKVSLNTIFNGDIDHLAALKQAAEKKRKIIFQIKR